MSRFASFCLATILAIAFVATTVQAEEITNEYFTLNVPQGWTKTVAPVQNGAVTVLLQSQKEMLVMTITVTPAPMPAKALAEQTAKNMKAGGIKVEQPVQQGASYTVAFEQPAKKVSGMSYFTSNGSKGSVITMMAPIGADGFAKAKEFLQKNLKPADAKLFPVQY